jgi:hypothetical protein
MSSQAVSFLFPTAVRDQVLGQHRVLRELLHESLQATTRAFQPEGPGLGEVADLVRELRSRFRAHLAFEERSLVPVLANVDLWGPERVQELLEEHDRQRAELDTLVEGIAEEWDVERLSLTLRSLATDLLIDMEEEERGCVNANLLRDELMVVGTVRE